MNEDFAYAHNTESGCKCAAFSTPELFSFVHDRRREELWGTLDQALLLFAVG